MRGSVFVSPEPDPGRLFVDTADDTRGNEDEVLIRLALHFHGDELHIVRGQLREHGRNPDVDHRDADVHRRVLREVVDAALGWGATTVGVVDSRLPGPKGNREFFVHLIDSADPVLLDDIDERIRAAVG